MLKIERRNLKLSDTSETYNLCIGRHHYYIGDKKRNISVDFKFDMTVSKSDKYTLSKKREKKV